MKARKAIRISFFLTTYFLIMFFWSCVANTEKKSHCITKHSDNSISFYSNTVHDTYLLYIDVPEGYATDIGTSYSTVYLLDANWNFANVQSWIRVQAGLDTMKKVILVGICPIESSQSNYTGSSYSRCRDLTPTVYQTDAFPGSGGAANFMKFFEDELFPYIDTNYRTIPNADNRCLAGHSFGGLFTLYAMLNHQDAFHKFLAASPSIFWDNRVMLTFESNYAAANTDMNCSLYTSVSDSEGMIDDHNLMVNQLKSRNYQGFTIFNLLIHGLDHNHSSVPAFQEGLVYLFGNQ